VEMVHFRTHRSLNPQRGNYICCRIPLFPSSVIYFLWEKCMSYEARKGSERRGGCAFRK
jgi:hypothetical protein